jgi:hypothetical protein
MTLTADKPASEFNSDLISANRAKDLLGIKAYRTFYEMNPAEKFRGKLIGKKMKYSVRAIQDYLS